MYNEEAVLPHLISRLRPVVDDLGVNYEIIAVDDGSDDSTPVLLQRYRREWDKLRVVRLRANAGHQSAISAGLVASRGEWVVTLDADLQDPPECIGEMMLVAQEQGVDVVYGVRTDRTQDTAFKRITAAWFYQITGVLATKPGPPGAGDFRLMSRATVDAVNALPEQHRVLRLVVPGFGFPSATVGYIREVRRAGESKYPLHRMVKLFVDTLTGYSLAPLRAATWLGVVGAMGGLLLMCYIVVSKLAGSVVPGWTSTVSIVTVLGATQLIAVGILGEYVGRMYRMMQGHRAYYVAYDSLTATDRPQIKQED